MVPVALIVKQPDLGTAILILASGFCLVFSGIGWQYILGFAGLIAAALPVLWYGS